MIQSLDNGILRSLRVKNRAHFMRRLLREVNSGKPVSEFIREYNVRNVVYCVANSWKSVDPHTHSDTWMAQIVANINVSDSTW